MSVKSTNLAYIWNVLLICWFFVCLVSDLHLGLVPDTETEKEITQAAQAGIVRFITERAMTGLPMKGVLIIMTMDPQAMVVSEL